MSDRGVPLDFLVLQTCELDYKCKSCSLQVTGENPELLEQMEIEVIGSLRERMQIEE